MSPILDGDKVEGIFDGTAVGVDEGRFEGLRLGQPIGDFVGSCDGRVGETDG